MSLRKTFTQGVFWTALQQFGSQIIKFGVSLILARILLPEEFGLIGMISVFIAVGDSLIKSGLTSSLIRTDNPTQEDYSTVFFFNIVGGIIIYILIFLLAPIIAEFYNQEILVNILRVYCLSFIIGSFGTVQSTRLTKIMDFKTQMLVQIPSLIVSGILGVILAYYGYGVWSLVWMSICQILLSTIQLWIRSKWKPSFIFSVSKFKYHLNFGYKLTLSGLLDTIFKNIYQIIIGKFFLASQVGYFTRANSLKQLPVNNLSAVLNKVTYPLFASIKNDDERLKRVYQEIMKMVVFIIAPILILMGVLAEPLFRFLFTEKWLPAVPYFQILCLSGILYPIHSYNLNILNVKGRSDLFLKLEVIKKILIVLIISISINFGIIGLLWGQLFGSIISLFINTYYSGKFINYNSLQQLKDISPIILLAFGVGIFIWTVDQHFFTNINDFIRLSILSTLGLILYIILSFILKMSSLKSIKNIIITKNSI